MITRALLVSLVCAVSTHAQSGGISIVSAASYRSVVAPESLASLFGTGLAKSTASATLDADGNLPTELASTRVEFNGTPAALIFVSPVQINLVVPAGIAAGSTAVVVISTDTNTTRTATAQIAASSPALFSSDASGSGAGAILNAVTFRPAPFLTVTIENGPDTRTRLAAYGTGFRNAKNVIAQAIDPSGNRYNLAVEYAGAAPGFAGLDQLNFLVPAAVDGAGAVSLSLATEDAVSNAVTFQMNLLPFNLLQLAGLALSPSAVIAGDTITGTVALNGVARSGGFLVSLRSSNLAAQPPTFVIIPQGNSTLDFVINTSIVANVQIGTITAQASSIVAAVNFEIDPQSQVQLSALSVTPTSSLGGRALQATVSLSGPAPGGGVTVQMASDNPAARPPATVTIPFNQAAVSFQIPTNAVTSPQAVTFGAFFNRVTQTSKVTLLPVFSLTLDPNLVVGGSTVTGTITLADPAPPGGITLTLSSSDAAAARVPAILTIFANQNFGTFNIITSPLSGSRTVAISAVYQNLTSTATLTLNPPPAPTLSSFTIAPDRVTGGQSAQGTITLAAPAPSGGIIVNLSSSSLIIARVPGFVTVQQGFTTAIFSVDTSRVPVTQSATIIATAGGITRTAVITVQ